MKAQAELIYTLILFLTIKIITGSREKINLSQVVCVCVCVYVCVFACVLRVLQHHSRIHHTSPATMQLYVYIKRTCLEFFLICIFDREKFSAERCALLYCSALD